MPSRRHVRITRSTRGAKTRINVGLVRSFGTRSRGTRPIGRIGFPISRWRRWRRIRAALSVGRVRSAIAIGRRVWASIGVGRRCRRRWRRVGAARRTGCIRRRPAVRLIRGIRRFVASVRQARLRRRLIGATGKREQHSRQPGRGSGFDDTCLRIVRRCPLLSIRSHPDLLLRAVFAPLVVMDRLMLDASCGIWIARSCKSL